MLATQLCVFDHKTDSHEKHDGLVVNKCIDITTKCRTNDTMSLNGVSIVKQTGGLTIHWSQLVYR